MLYISISFFLILIVRIFMNILTQNINTLQETSRENVLREIVTSLSNEGKQELLLKLMQQPHATKSQSSSLSDEKISQYSQPSSQSFPQTYHIILPKPQKVPKDNSSDGYKDEIKIEAVKYAMMKNNNGAAARYMKQKYKEQGKCQGLSEKSIRDWRRDERYNPDLKYDQSHKGRKQTRRISSPFLAQETDLVQIIKMKRSAGEQVSRDFIIAEARKLIPNPQFKASPGWLSNFKKRWNIRRRVPTSVVQKLCVHYTQQVQH